MNPYREYIEDLLAAVEKAKALKVSGRRAVPEAASRALIFSPHPDDECVIGLLPLRLMREAGMQVINVPVTFGSRVDRQEARAAELDAACAYLGWGLARVRADYNPLEVEEVAGVLRQHQPEIVFFPHARDWNVRHVSTHRLLMDALSRMDEAFSCLVAETEFWGAMDDPNLMVEGEVDLVADLVAATSLHEGEVARNPYHLLLPAWMQDNVRRGGELVGGQGQAAPDFHFATLYRLRRWAQGKLVDVLDRGLLVPAGAAGLKEIVSWK